MATRSARHSGLWEYLEKSGVLVSGSDEEIKTVRREYRKIYLKQYKQQQRKHKPEFLVQLSRDGELTTITAAAKKHRMSVTAFLRLATLSYISRVFLIPDRQLVGKLAGLLESCLNEVRAMTSVKTKQNSFLLEEKYDAIERRIIELQSELQKLFFHPALLESAVAEAIRIDPTLRDRLQIILSHAHRED